MTEKSTPTGPGARSRTPWHLWAASLFLLALYAIGAWDYLQTRALNQDYFAAQGYHQQQIDYFTDYPTGLAVLWAINIVAGLAAPVAALLRSRWALPLAGTAAIAQIILMIITFTLRDRWTVLGPRMSLTDIGVGVLTLAYCGYCWRLSKSLVLR